MPKLLIIGYVWPEPNSSAAGSRMMQLIDFFISENHEITFATTAQPTDFMANLNEKGVKTCSIALNSSSFDDFIKKLEPQVVLFDRFMMEEQFGWRVSEACPSALKILDTEDLHFLRKARHEAFSKQKNLNEILLQSDAAKREIASIYRCDLSLVISSAEMQLLIDVFKLPEHILLYLPFMLQAISEEEKEKLPLFENRKNFVAIGNFKHAPNWDAVLFLKQKIWPLIRKELPEANLEIYGAYPTGKVFQLHNAKEGFLVKGRAENAKEVVEASRVLLAPLRFGAGLKGKLAEAMQCGTPSITTSIGAEGMQHQNLWPGAIEDDEAAFAAAAVALYQDKKQWLQAQQIGFEILEAKFSKAKNERQLKEKIQAVLRNLDFHRLQNFTGAMLQHHHNMGTKYLSKYIECKNAKE